MNRLMNRPASLLAATILTALTAGMAPVSGAFASDLSNADAPRLPAFSKLETAKLSGSLLQLEREYREYQARSGHLGGLAPLFAASDRGLSIVAGSVVIDAASDDSKALAEALRELGASNVHAYGRMVSAALPLESIAALKSLPSLKLARPAYLHRHSGTVTSQGDVALRANVARTTYSVDGTGVKVGTLSDSYNCLGTAAASVSSGNLPAGVIVLADAPCPGSDEGRAMMEIIHDVAPGASLSFHTAAGGEAAFAAGIIALAADGAKVINDDISYGSEPFFQDGVIAQAVDTVKSQGVAYFTSSGNGARKAYESEFRPSGQNIDIGFGPSEAHDFDPGADVDICQQITLSANDSIALSFQWDQPFFSVSGAPGSESDLDILVTNAACDTSAPLASSANSNVGGDPLEIVSFTNPGPATTFGVVILRSAGPNPGLMKVIDTAEAVVFDEFATDSGASYGHPLAKGGLGVAAAYYGDTPEFGTSPPIAEGSSSAGGGAILFDIAGNRLAMPDVRQQPAITAPDGGDTSFFGGSDPDGTGFPNFFGTSAAAPHAAAVAALMLANTPTLDPDALYAAMKNATVDMDDPLTAGFDLGFDFKTGFGLLQADAALAPPSDFIFANSFE